MKPIIDAHGHIFNGRDIPLKGYLLSRRSKKLMEKLFSPLLAPAIAKCIRRHLNPDRKETFIRNVFCCLTLEIVYKLMGKEYRHWAHTLSQKVTDVASEYIATFQKNHVDLHVPLMIDYEYWFKNTQDNPIKDQIEHMYEKIVIPYGGLIHPFVAFDPAREIVFRKGLANPDGKPEKYGSLQLVKDAIENKGFIGVKLYNSMGYKPFNNVTVEDKRKKIAMHKKKYVFKGEEYDDVLAEFYDYCIENEVPITTHCGMYGIESYHDASFDFGQGIFWRDVLSQERFKNLHLNLGHFGWNSDTGYGGKKNWVKDICEMFNDYEFLYADVAAHRVYVEKLRESYLKDYQQMLQDFPIVKKRLLFGPDWHIIKRVANYQNFTDAHVTMFLENNLYNDEEITDFLGGNALLFLGLLPGNKNRKRIEKFYKDHEIEPPEWFNATKK